MKHKLRVILEQFGHNQNDLADLLGITNQSVSIKLNRKKDFTQSEIYKIIQCYNLTAEQVMDIFFSPEDRYTE